MEKYILSIIIDCHYQNDIDNINETISSFNHVENIEVILLNSLCKNFQNVKYVDKDSFYLALTEAKNICLGKYTYIIEAGDRFYQNSLNQLLVHLSKEKYDIVHFNLIDHKNHFQVEKTYLNRGGEEYTSYSINKLPIKLKETFFKTELIKTISFLEQMDNSFELDFFAKIIKDDNIKCYKDYSSVLEYYHDSELVSIEHSKTISAFLQEILLVDELSPYQEYYTLNEIKKYLSKQSIKYHDEYFDDDEKKEFLKVFKNILSKISIIAIQSISSIVMPYKNYLLELKFDDSNNLDRTIQKVNKKSFISYQDNPMFDIEGIGNFKINVLESKNNILILDGVDVFSFLGHQYQIIAIDDHKNTYKPQLFKWTLQDRKGFIGDTVYQGRRFRFEIPLNQIKHIKFVLRANDNHDFELNPSFGNFAKLVKKYRMSYYAKDNYIFQYRKKGISIIPKNWKCHLKFEIKFMIQLFKLKKINAIILRFSYYLMNIFLKKPVWLMRDNEKRAKDSGAEMFKYFSTWDKKSDYNGYFILDHHCSDYQNMRKYGKIIQPESFRYKLYHLLADKLIDTRGSVTPQYIFKEDYQFVSDLCQWDYIWLIHGIMTRNESTWTNKYAINAKLFATCNDREYQSVLDEKNGYGYSKKEVALTGLPRHDALSANKQKKILFLPTWRKHLAGDLIPGTSDRSYVDNFKESDFFQFYNSLINDERLLTAMKEKGYKGDFYLHPSFMKQCYDFDENEFIHIGKEAADTNKLIGESSILLTDYSSAQFEGAYLDTPVIYPQYDAETFSDNHTGQEGYFDYERDGFGPVCYNLDQTVKAIIEYLENDCQNKEPYQSRARDFFAYRDHNNSQRVFEQILKIDGQSNKDIKIEEDNENVYLYQGIDLKNAVIKKEIYKLYNPVFHLNSFVKKIKMKQKSFVIDAEIILDEKDFRLPHDCFKVSIGSYSKKINYTTVFEKKGKKHFRFQIEVVYKDILLTKKSTPIYLIWEDDNGYGYRGYLKYQYIQRLDTLANRKKRKLHYSNVQILEDIQSSIFIRETMGNNVYLCVRDINVTDSPKEQKKLKRAYLLSKIFYLHSARKSILYFEKFAHKYEESASVLFEKMIDEGHKNVYFIIDKESIHYQSIPSKYKKYIIEKYSFKHYFYFFMSRIFIATESMNHCIELNIADPNVTLKITKGEYDYIFLQHGVMYMYCLENRSDFIKGQGFTKNSKVVVSSQTEANHFIEYGNFEQEDLIISGLPKFDRNTRNEDADKILIMPTSRDFEYNIIRLTPMQSTYYRFVKNIINAVPKELKDKIVVVGHPLLKDQLESTDLKQYMPKQYVYNELLKDTKLLITDYSSISYDAFYRGCNVIFCWEDKEMCLEQLGYKLMLNDDNVFSDVSYHFNDLTSLIQKNYYSKQSEKYIEKYRHIVTYHDNCNTQRCYKTLKDLGYLNKKKLTNIKRCKITNFTKKVYSGEKRIHTKLEVYDRKKLLVKNRDYKVFYFNNKRKGRFALALFVGIGRYYGLKLRRFRICESIMNFDVYGVDMINTHANFDKVSLRQGNGKYLRKDKDYIVEEIPSDISNVVTVLIQGKKKYAGKIKLLFRIK